MTTAVAVAVAAAAAAATTTTIQTFCKVHEVSNHHRTGNYLQPRLSLEFLKLTNFYHLS